MFAIFDPSLPYISGMIFIVPSPNEMKAAINKKDERKGISEKGKKRRRKIRDEKKLKMAPPAL